MFARFTDDARELVVDAQHDALRLHHRWIGCEHLLFALTRRRCAVADAFADHGVTTEAVACALGELIPPVVTDSVALASIGIDLEEVRAQVEASFGPGALERATRTKPRWRHRRHRRRRTVVCSELATRRFLVTDDVLPFTPRAKRALEIAANAASPQLAGPKHLGLALIARTDTVAGEILGRLSVDPVSLRNRLVGIAELP